MKMKLKDGNGNGDGAHPQAVAPHVFVLFGGAGDLAKRKIVPALYNLARQGLLPEAFALVGIGSTPKSNEDYRALMRSSVEEFSRKKPVEDAIWSKFGPKLYFLSGDFGSDALYADLKATLQRIDREHATDGNRLFYLATPPSFFGPIATSLGRAGVMRRRKEGTGFVRLIVEKPFGRDEASARQLNDTLLSVLDEQQIYRIDHYLGKETVQNLMVFRFANTLFEPVWNRRYIDHVQITVAESIGIEHRARYYEESGALRDMVQNHLLQLMTLVAMEPPPAFDADAVRDEKVKVLRSIRPLAEDEIAHNVIRGQYETGILDRQSVPGYREEEGVAPKSQVETFVAWRLFVDNWRWQDVPFYLRTGKRLPRRVSEIAIQFKRVPHLLFRFLEKNRLKGNLIVIRLQPDEAISVRFESKIPGPDIRVQAVDMDFRWDEAFGNEQPEAYETLLLDCMQGDGTLFNRNDQVEVAWRLTDPILNYWKETEDPVPTYAAGTWGPQESHIFLAQSGHTWRQP